MKARNVLKRSSWWMVNKSISKVVGINASVLLSFLCEQSDYFKEEWFYVYSEKIEDETTLKYSVQKGCVDKLKEAGFIETKFMDSPRKLYFRIIDANIDEAMDSIVTKNESIELRNSHLYNCENRNYINAKNESIELRNSHLSYNKEDKEYKIKNKEERRKPSPSKILSENLPTKTFISGTEKKEDIHDVEDAVDIYKKTLYIGTLSKDMEKKANEVRDVLRKKYKEDFDAVCDKIDAPIPDIMNAFVEYFCIGKGREINKNHHAGLFSSFKQWAAMAGSTGEKSKIENDAETDGGIMSYIQERMGMVMSSQARIALKKIVEEGYFDKKDWKDMIAGLSYGLKNYDTLSQVAQKRLKHKIKV